MRYRYSSADIGTSVNRYIIYSGERLHGKRIRPWPTETEKKKKKKKVKKKKKRTVGNPHFYSKPRVHAARANCVGVGGPRAATVVRFPVFRNVLLSFFFFSLLFTFRAKSRLSGSIYLHRTSAPFFFFFNSFQKHEYVLFYTYIISYYNDLSLRTGKKKY